MVKCYACKGTGYQSSDRGIIGVWPCFNCNGSGEIPELNMKILTGGTKLKTAEELLETKKRKKEEKTQREILNIIKDLEKAAIEGEKLHCQTSRKSGVDYEKVVEKLEELGYTCRRYGLYFIVSVEED